MNNERNNESSFEKRMEQLRVPSVQERNAQLEKKQQTLQFQKQLTKAIIGFFISFMFWLSLFVVSAVLHRIWMNDVTLTLIVVASIVFTIHVLVALLLKVIQLKSTTLKTNNTKEGK